MNENIIVKDKNGNDKTIKRFLVSTDFTDKNKIPRSYIPLDLCNTDIACSEGKIGECINLVQMLNSVYWTMKVNRVRETELLKLYKDISNLNVLSCIIIDSAKKSSPVKVSDEMDRIRAKGYLKKKTRPYFFKFLDGSKKYKFKKYKTGMDYLVTIMNNSQRKIRDSKNGRIDLHDILIKQRMNDADRRKIQNFTDLVTKEQFEISKIYENDKLEKKEQYRQVQNLKAEFQLNFDKTTLNKITIYTIIKRLDKATNLLDNNRKIMQKQIKDLKKLNKNNEVNEINQIKKQFKIDNKDSIKYKKIGRGLLRHLYEYDTAKFLSCFIVKNSISTIYRSENGDIDLYGVKYKRL